MNFRQIAGVFAIGICGGAVGALLIGGLAGVEASAPEVMDELNVKRINIVEDNGNFALVIANSKNLPGSTLNGKQQGMREGVPGIIFYNNFGDEIGGLIYPAREMEYGYDGGVQLSMDQIKQTGQAIALRHWRNGGYVRSVLEITDYATDKFAGDANDDPDVKAVLAKMREASGDEEVDRIYFREYLPMLGEKGYLAHRIFLGSEGAENRRAMLELKDSRSRPRIRLVVDEQDEPRIEILDEDGKIIRTISGEVAQ